VALVIIVIGQSAFSDASHHADNFSFVDRYHTPRHIVPEWYFLPFYAILRCCPAKCLGVVMLVSAVLLFGFAGSVPIAY
jgi:quinol-cytochrome oxidoreductase complex cytochrome b subunit